MVKKKQKETAEPAVIAPEIEIEDGIELPARTRVSKYPVAKLEVGQSFRLPDGVSGAGFKKRGKTLGFTVTVRTMPDGSRRVFRLE